MFDIENILKTFYHARVSVLSTKRPQIKSYKYFCFTIFLAVMELQINSGFLAAWKSCCLGSVSLYQATIRQSSLLCRCQAKTSPFLGPDCPSLPVLSSWSGPSSPNSRESMLGQRQGVTTQMPLYPTCQSCIHCIKVLWWAYHTVPQKLKEETTLKNKHYGELGKKTKAEKQGVKFKWII